MAVALSGRHQEIDVVETQKHDHRAEGGALVAIDEWMISGKAERIGCCKRSQVGFAVGAIC